MQSTSLCRVLTTTTTTTTIGCFWCSFQLRKVFMLSCLIEWLTNHETELYFLFWNLPTRINAFTCVITEKKYLDVLTKMLSFYLFTFTYLKKKNIVLSSKKSIFLWIPLVTRKIKETSSSAYAQFQSPKLQENKRTKRQNK
jgi:hypothetical protein